MENEKTVAQKAVATLSLYHRIVEAAQGDADEATRKERLDNLLRRILQDAVYFDSLVTPCATRTMGEWADIEAYGARMERLTTRPMGSFIPV